VNYESGGALVTALSGDLEKSLVGRYFLAILVSQMRQKYGVFDGLNDF